MPIPAPRKSVPVLLTLLLAASTASAATYNWQTAGTTNTWNATDTDWFVDAGTTLSAWADGNAAVFNAATGETVTFTDTLTPASIDVGTNNGNWTFSGTGVLAGAGSLTKNGTGTLIMSDTTANTYAGGTIINGGTLQIGTGSALTGSGAALGTGTITVNSGGTLKLWVTANSTTTTYANAITLNGGIIRGEDGVNNLTGAVSVGASGGTFLAQWAGKTVSVSGVVSGSGAVTIDAAPGNYGSNVIFNNAGNTFTGNITVTAGSLSTGTVLGGGTQAYLGANNGSRTITVSSGAKLNLNANNIFGTGTQVLANIPNVILNGGTLTSTVYNILGNITLNGATLTQSTAGGAYQGYQFLGSTVTVGGTAASTISSTSGAGNQIAGGSTVTFNVGVTGAVGGDLIVSTALIDSAGDRPGVSSITKTGGGTLLFSGANTYSGTTAINAGTIATGNVSALGTSATIVGGGKLTVGAAGLTGIASLTVNTGGLDTTAGAVTTTGAFVLAGGTWTIGATASQVVASGFTITGGVIDLTGFTGKSTAGSSFNLIGTTGSASGLTFTGGASGFTYAVNTSGNLVVAAVPEPSTYGLMGAGVMAAIAVVRRRRNKTGDAV